MAVTNAAGNEVAAKSLKRKKKKKEHPVNKLHPGHHRLPRVAFVSVSARPRGVWEGACGIHLLLLAGVVVGGSCQAGGQRSAARSGVPQTCAAVVIISSATACAAASTAAGKRQAQVAECHRPPSVWAPCPCALPSCCQQGPVPQRWWSLSHAGGGPQPVLSACLEDLVLVVKNDPR